VIYKRTASNVNKEWSGQRQGSANEIKTVLLGAAFENQTSKEIDLEPRIASFVCTQADNGTDTLHNIMH
jgi:hypothetical protein